LFKGNLIVKNIAPGSIAIPYVAYYNKKLEGQMQRLASSAKKTPVATSPSIQDNFKDKIVP